MKAIKVTYKAATDKRGARWRVTTSAALLWVPMDYSQRDDGQGNAALAMVNKMGWNHLFDTHTIVRGSIGDDTFFVWADKGL